MSGAVYFAVLAGAVVLLLRMSRPQPPAAPAATASDAPDEELSCALLEHGIAEPSLPEASGLALSRRTPGVLWSINDSGTSRVVALDLAGRMLGIVRIAVSDVINWEDVSVAPCDNGSCLFITDGGNSAGTQRNDLIVYRVPEPGPDDTRAPQAPVVFNVAYPEGEDHETEAMFVVDGQLCVVTKGHPSRVFRVPRAMSPESLAQLEYVGAVPTERFLPTTIPRRIRITDAETSPDGRWVALRTNEALLLYRSEDIANGRMQHLWHADLKSLNEPQGEGVALSDDGNVYLAGEGADGVAPGTFAHMKCALPQ